MLEQLANEAVPVVREDYNVVACIYICISVNSIIHPLMGRVWESLTKLGTYSVNFGIACLSVIILCILGLAGFTLRVVMWSQI